MESRPEWVPERIWTLWLDHRNTNFCWDPCEDEPEYIHPRPATQKAIRDPECECVWVAMERRFDEGAVRLIFDAIDFSTGGPCGSHGETPHAVRSRLGKKVARLSCSLRDALLEVADAASMPPDELDRRLRIPLELSVPLDHAIQTIAESKKIGPEMDVFGHMALSSVVHHFDDVLAALGAAGSAWASSRPEVTAKGSDPRRLHFIRELTRWFRQLFDTPLREQVAALTRCVYECDMEASTVAKLAP